MPMAMIPQRPRVSPPFYLQVLSLHPDHEGLHRHVPVSLPSLSWPSALSVASLICHFYFDHPSGKSRKEEIRSCFQGTWALSGRSRRRTGEGQACCPQRTGCLSRLDTAACPPCLSPPSAQGHGCSGTLSAQGQPGTQVGRSAQGPPHSACHLCTQRPAARDLGEGTNDGCAQTAGADSPQGAACWPPSPRGPQGEG